MSVNCESPQPDPPFVFGASWLGARQTQTASELMVVVGAALIVRSLFQTPVEGFRYLSQVTRTTIRLSWQGRDRCLPLLHEAQQG